MIPISVCIIAKNEEKTIERCLQALKQYPFEIIVTDTGSTDRTKEIAAKYADKVFDFIWTNDFSAARNFCASKASHDWILSIDCDEYLEPFDSELLDAQLNSNSHSFGTIIIKNQTTTRSGQDTFFTMSVSRIFNRKYCKFFSPIHEQILPIDAENSLPHFSTKLSVIHSGYIGDDDKLKAKQERNIALLKASLLSTPAIQKPYIYFQLAQSYKLFDAGQALLNYEKALKSGANPDAPYFIYFITEYAYTLYYNGRAISAMELLEKYYKELSHHGEYLFVLAFLCMNCRYYERAITLFQAAIHSSEYYTEGANSYISYYNIGTIYKLLGKWEEAIQYFKECGSYKDAPKQIRLLTEKKKHPLPLSVCLIGRNEEKYLDECLRCLAPLNCDIVFVDTGSTDSTVSIARRYTEQLYFYEWAEDFSAARNFSVSKATNDWILAIDCDEFLQNPEELYRILPSFLEAATVKKNEVGIITITSKTIENAVESNSKSEVARFFSKSHCHFEGRIHEQILTVNSEVTPRYMTPFQVFHMGYYGEDIALQKARRNLPLLHRELEDKGASPYLYYQLGKACYTLADYENALKYFDLGLAMDVDPEQSYVQEMVVHYGYSLLELGRVQEALSLEGIYDTFCSYADFVFLMGLIYMKNALFTDAIRQFEKAVECTSFTVAGTNSFLPLYNIGVIYECSGYKEKAIEYYKRCGSYAPAQNRIKELGI